MTFSDTNSPVFPSPQDIPILSGTKYIMLTCNLPECVWMITNESDVIMMTSDSYIIPEISHSYSGNFSLLRNTSTGVSYTTAQIHIHAQSITQSPSNSALVAVVVLVVILTIALCAIAIIILPIIYSYVNRRHTTRRLNPPIPVEEEFPVYRNVPLSEESVEFPVTPNPVYVTFDITSNIPVESENEQRQLEDEVVYELIDTHSYEEINDININSKEEKQSVVKSIPKKRILCCIQTIFFIFY